MCCCCFARSGHESLVRELLKLGTNTQNRDQSRQWTALMWAADRGHAAISRLLAGPRQRHLHASLGDVAGNGGVGGVGLARKLLALGAHADFKVGPSIDAAAL